MNLKPTNFDTSWTLFLDRDGVINTKVENDYIKRWNDFHFISGVLASMPILRKKFNRILIVTNQQGIGKGLFTEQDLAVIHSKMLTEIMNTGCNIEKVYFCPALVTENSVYRKPNIGMALQAKKDFSDIDFSKSIMLGDSISDMEFGKNAGMKTAYITNISNKNTQPKLIDWVFESLEDFTNFLK